LGKLIDEDSNDISFFILAEADSQRVSRAGTFGNVFTGFVVRMLDEPLLMNYRHSQLGQQLELLTFEIGRLRNELARFRQLRMMERLRNTRYQARLSLTYTIVSALGSVVGASVIFAIIIVFLSRLEAASLIGRFIGEIVRIARTPFPP